MAGGAIMIKIVHDMVWVRGGGKVGAVAVKTIGRRAGELLLGGSGMAHFAIRGGVCTYERKSSLEVD